MVRIRLKRFGRRNRAFFRICVMDQRSQRDGKAIEELGFYDPIEPAAEKALQINGERARHWLSVGAQPSETVRDLFRKAGVTAAAEPAGTPA